MTNERNIILFELSGEHPELPQAELNTVLQSLMIKSDEQFSIQFDFQNRTAYVEIKNYPSDLMQKLKNRLAMVHNIHHVIFKESYVDIFKKISKLPDLNIKSNTTFKLITRHLKNRQKTSKGFEERIRNDIIHSLSKFSKVDIKSPDVEFVLFFGQDMILTKKIFDIDRSDFESRKPQFRPYFAPISLHPRLARCMVNLAGLSDSGTIIDPFCGTGGILIEAGLMGFNTIGADVENKMVEGTKANLEHWGIKNYQLIQTDICDLPKSLAQMNEVDAIVTEPPYGRATGLQGRSIKSLIEESFNIFQEILPNGQHLIISLPDEKLADFAKNEFSVQNKFKIRIHRSLTKTIFVFRKR
jgi:tRNA (guanine10-N2)-dimethyltransferase